MFKLIKFAITRENNIRDGNPIEPNLCSSKKGSFRSLNNMHNAYICQPNNVLVNPVHSPLHTMKTALFPIKNHHIWKYRCSTK